MNLEELIKNMKEDNFLYREDTENIEFFKECIKLGRIDLAVQCKSFITDEFIKEHIDKIIIINKRLSSYRKILENNKTYRDILIERKEYELLLILNYSILIEIKDETIIEELDKLADKEIESGHLTTDYSKYRAMKLNRLDIIATSSLPFDPIFYDTFYEQLKTIIGNLKYENYYLSRKCMLMGDFDLAYKVNSYLSLEEKELIEVVNNHWEKVLAHTAQEIPRVFCSSKKLFDYYLEQKRFDLVCQFASSLLTEEIVEKHKSEFLKLSDPLKGQGVFNKALFNIFLENKKYEICIKFLVTFSPEVIEKHGRELSKHMTEISHTNQGNKQLFDLLLELKRYELITMFDSALLTSEVLTKHGEEIVKQFTEIPYGFRSNPNLLISIIKAKRFDLIENFYQDAFTDDVLTEYGEELFKNITELPYYLKTNIVALKCVLKVKKYDFVDEFYFSNLPADFIELEEFKEYLKVTNVINYAHRNDPRVFEIVLENKRYDLVNQFYGNAFTESNIEKLIDLIPKNSTELPYELLTTTGFIKIVKKGRYDLITNGKFREIKIDESFLQEYGLELLTKTEFLDSYKRSNTLLRQALDNNLSDLIGFFSFEAYDDDIIDKYSESLLPILKEKLDEFQIPFMGFRFNRKTKKIKLRSLLIILLEQNELDNIPKFDDKIFDEEIIDKYYEKILIIQEKYKRNFLQDNSYLFNRIMAEKKFEYVGKFSASLFTREIIEEYGDSLIEYFSEKRLIPCCLQSNSLLLEKCYEKRIEKTILQFYESAYTDEIINKYYDVILEIIKNNNDEIAYSLQSPPLFKRFLKEKKYDYINKMQSLNLREKDILENYDDIVTIVNLDINSNFAIKMSKSITFIEKYLEICPLEYLEYIDVTQFDNTTTLDRYIPKLLEWLSKYKNNKIPLELIRSEKFKNYCKDNNLKELYLGFVINSNIKNISELQKIVDEYAPILKMDPDRLRRRLEELYVQNDEICQTLLPLMLEDRMNNLSRKHYLTIALYPDLQYEITNLNDKELLLIERILTYTDESNLDITTILYNVLKNLRNYKTIIDYSAHLEEDQLSNLIYVLQRSNNVFDINNVEDLREERFNAKVISKFSEF